MLLWCFLQIADARNSILNAPGHAPEAGESIDKSSGRPDTTTHALGAGGDAPSSSHAPETGESTRATNDIPDAPIRAQGASGDALGTCPKAPTEACGMFLN